MPPTPPGEAQDELDSIPIRDNGEPLVDFLQTCPILRLAPVHPVFEFPRVHLLRSSVAEKLCDAAKDLPSGLQLEIVEGYRPMAVQKAMFRYAVEQTRQQHPDWNQEQILARAGRRSAPPTAKSPPPHTTGGAFDIQIVDETGTILDFTSPYELTDWRQAAPDAPGLSQEARANRKLLRRVLEPTGLTNYVDEWWHWSYGDSGWALRVGAKYAIYDFIEPPADAHWVGDMNKLPQE